MTIRLKMRGESEPETIRWWVYCDWLPGGGLAAGGGVAAGGGRQHAGAAAGPDVYVGLDLLGLSGQGSAGVSPANSITAAGGIGGLLGTHDWGADVSSTDDDESYLHFYDGNGNTGQLVYAKSNTNSGSTAGDLAATYEYDAYGNVTAQAGPYANANRFRFSTKMFDAESGLGYWGYRHYRPETGRWVSRDPIGQPENGATTATRFTLEATAQPYVAILNAPGSVIDATGLTSLAPPTPGDTGCTVDVISGDSTWGSGSGPGGTNFRHVRLKVYLDGVSNVVEYGPRIFGNCRASYGEKPEDHFDGRISNLPDSVCDCINSAPDDLGLYNAIGDNSNTAAKCVLARCLERGGAGSRIGEAGAKPGIHPGWDRDCDEIYDEWDRQERRKASEREPQR